MKSVGEETKRSCFQKGKFLKGSSGYVGAEINCPMPAMLWGALFSFI